MAVLAKKQEQIRPYLDYGVVLAQSQGSFTVDTAAGPVQGEPAVGCVVRPAIGDTVLLSLDQADTCFILCVLQREPGAKTRTQIRFNGDVDLQVDGGDLTLSSSQKIALASSAIALHADKGKAVIGELSFSGRALHSRFKRIQVVANTVEHVCRRFTQRLHDSFRFIKDHEEIQTGNTRYLVEDTLTMHAKNATHMAEELVTITAEQIHLG